MSFVIIPLLTFGHRALKPVEQVLVQRRSEDHHEERPEHEDGERQQGRSEGQDCSPMKR
jgi:hypothetical protein